MNKLAKHTIPLLIFCVTIWSLTTVAYIFDGNEFMACMNLAVTVMFSFALGGELRDKDRG